MGFRLMMLFFVVASIQGFFISGVLFFYQKGIPNRLLALFILLFSICLLDWVGFWTNHYNSYPLFTNISISFSALYGPILFFYYRYSVENYKFNKNDLWHFILPVFILIKYLPYYSFNWFGYKTGWRFLWEMTIFSSTDITPYLLLISVFAYSAYLWYKYTPLFKSHVYQLSWHRYLVLFFFLFGVNSAIYVIWNRFLGGIPIYFDLFISFVIVVAIYSVTMLAYIRPEVFAGMSIIQSIKQLKYRKNGLGIEQGRKIVAQLDQLMQEQKLYLESGLKVDEIARKMGVSNHHISQAINEQLKINFSDYVNHFRVKEAETLLKTKTRQEMNIIEIAYEVGFNNKNSFNNAFKKVVGVTATEYRSSLKPIE
ncbi:AraC family transcriptional regulator [Emticicia sp. BO119]|uniref:helix-turn-helix domain-containing protein n=1 Tax=Emticicia sp. BO119 TaxID=2757768 RepID=UPI0015F01FAB|nr:AraC family transcriptional regulator [Emticicia sp. BO119]MBA4849284.1 helix-turn-helix transcriptional regulator [Emticicia sp. BO119]